MHISTEFIGWGLQMTVLGMGLVFALLALLWLLLTIVLKLDKEDAPEVEVSAHEAIQKAEQIAAVADDAIGAQVPERPTVNGMPADLVAAIMTAVLHHRTTLRRQAAPFMRTYWPGSQLFASRWVAAGRARQNNNWQPRGK